MTLDRKTIAIGQGRSEIEWDKKKKKQIKFYGENITLSRFISSFIHSIYLLIFDPKQLIQRQ